MHHRDRGTHERRERVGRPTRPGICVPKLVVAPRPFRCRVSGVFGVPIRKLHGRCRTAAFALALCLVAAFRVFACGPFFPNTLLDQGDAAVLTAPEARFRLELERMKLVASVFRARPATNFAQQTFDAELADLRTALDKNAIPPKQRDAVLKRHRLEREKILIFSQSERKASADSATHIWWKEGFALRPDTNNAARISGPMPQIAPGLPGEFADYFRGSVAWHLGKMPEARAAWTALLGRRALERQFKSTWAAFMLGKSWEEEDNRQAISYFQQVRALAKAGFADSLALAASSLGWEARLRLLEDNFAPAIDLYLEQAASGDPSAVISLRSAASTALRASESKLRSLAAHPRAQRVITAYVISGGWREQPMDVDSAAREGMIRAFGAASAKVPVIPKPKPNWHRIQEPAMRWLEAVEAAGVKDVESAEQLALAAYQGGEMERTARWLSIARPTPVAQWLRAKLLLRDGKAGEAAALIAKLIRVFPLDSARTNPAPAPGLVDSLYVKTGLYESASIAEQLHGEWGVFRLARRQYTESLDALLRSGYWLDAAYVAERVLTLDELKSYVDRYWPETLANIALEPRSTIGNPASASSPSPPQNEERAGERKTVAVKEGAPHPTPLTAAQIEGEESRLSPARPESTVESSADEIRETSPAERIRYLLARRLARAEHRDEARRYFPAEWLPQFDALCAALRVAQKAERPPIERGRALFEAAKITRHQGLELIGTEVEPDWQVHSGNYQYGVTVADRISLQRSNVLAAATEELARGAQHTVNPDKRWHYRYQAASLAWEAARLMPNNSDDTARALCLGGTWIKNRNPKAADVFYKALVRRCRKTALGAEADRLRWFPLVDADGNLRPRPEPPRSSEGKDAAEKVQRETTTKLRE